MTDPDNCPPWCRRGPHRSDPWELRHDGNALTLWLTHEPDGPIRLAVTATSGEFTSPAAVFPLPHVALLAEAVSDLLRESRRRADQPPR